MKTDSGGSAVPPRRALLDEPVGEPLRVTADTLCMAGAALTEAQRLAAKEWAADDRLWTTQETVEFNLLVFAQKILALGLAAGSALPAGWQPIETAPKDGTHVLLWNGYRRAIGWFARYSDASLGWHRQNVLDEPLGPRDIDPDTHWSPLPAPPEGQ